MIQLESLRIAITKLDEAEDALYNARQSMGIKHYAQIDDQYEIVGDAATILRHILNELEVQTLDQLLEA
jgi:hypothetical protein